MFLISTCFTCCSVFEQDPGAKQLFTRVNVADMDSPEFQGHMLRVVNGLDLLMNLMRDPPTMIAAGQHLAEQHAARPGVTANYFKVDPIQTAHKPDHRSNYCSVWNRG